MERLNKYRKWFLAAAIYNALWGAVVVLWPDAMFKWIGVPFIGSKPIFQSVGMMVGAYAIGYWMIARDPVRFGPFVVIGLLGKLAGPIGFLWSAIRGDLPWAFGWVNLTNDVIWLPAFIGFAIELWRFERA